MRVLKSAVLVTILGTPSVQAQSGSDIVKVELFSDAIRLHHQSGTFFAPHEVRAGDSFASLSRKYYGTPDYAGTLAEVNGVSPLEPLQPGSFVYITASSVDLKFKEKRAAAQLAVIRRFLATVGAATELTYVWDEAEMDMEMGKDGKWLLKKYNTAKLRIFPARAKSPELQLQYPKSPLLQIITANDTVIEQASVRQE